MEQGTGGESSKSALRIRNARRALLGDVSGRRFWATIAEMNFEELANEHKDAVYRQMLRVCGNHADAEDVLMEALLKAYRSLEQLREAVAFKAWLGQIARRLCWQLREREALAPLLQLSVMEDEGMELASRGEAVDVELARREMKGLLWQAINELPGEAREMYLLRDVEELSGEEVARKLGISVPAMKSRLHRARQAVRERLDQILSTGGAQR
jgi:RNA polymerase sigma-70 factor (ECF subfamily)